MKNHSAPNKPNENNWIIFVLVMYTTNTSIRFWSHNTTTNSPIRLWWNRWAETFAEMLYPDAKVELARTGIVPLPIIMEKEMWDKIKESFNSFDNNYRKDIMFGKEVGRI